MHFSRILLPCLVTRLHPDHGGSAGRPSTQVLVLDPSPDIPLRPRARRNFTKSWFNRALAHMVSPRTVNLVLSRDTHSPSLHDMRMVIRQSGCIRSAQAVSAPKLSLSRVASLLACVYSAYSASHVDTATVGRGSQDQQIGAFL